MIDRDDQQPRFEGESMTANDTWVTPRIERMRAGDAEVGTRTNRSDGAFTQS